ncbi:phosphatidylinositol 3-kinase regulatory subunit alpha-like [Sardina pilchardus]|uniref:phosphatidylinositol 3-kinase regulatory subunit alpha-like n=1 Tax=Sardina pilchardus TaxID=27697 RepID=UPI002E115B58
MASDSVQYRALFEYKRQRGDDISLQPGDILTVNKASLLSPDYQEREERSPKGWLHGTNERTKEKGDFPGTFVEYVGVVRVSPPATKTWTRPVPPTPGGAQTPASPPPPGASASAAGAGQQEAPEVLALPEQAPVAVLRLTEALERPGYESEPLYKAPPASTGPSELRQALDEVDVTALAPQGLTPSPECLLQTSAPHSSPSSPSPQSQSHSRGRQAPARPCQ